MTVAEAFPMKSILNHVPTKLRPQPDTFHERTGHVLPTDKSKVFDMIKHIEEYADQNKMKVNYGKTKLMVFNPGAKEIFFHDLSLMAMNFKL